MKKSEIEKLVAPVVTSIQKCCELNDVALKRVVCSGAVTNQQRKHGIQGSVTVVLGDDMPGWRASENNAGRIALKEAVREVFAKRGLRFDVKLQASYSCLSLDDGNVVRRDAKGNVVAIYDQTSDD